jgi:hypothetical protein
MILLLPLLLLLQSGASAIGQRPIVEVPADMTAEYFRQAYVIEHAQVRQASAIEAMKTFCEKNAGDLKKTRSEQDEVLFVCTPKEPKK